MKTKLILFISLTIFGYSYAQIGFQEHIIATNYSYRIYATDIDGDGYMDMLSASNIDTIAWHENTDGQGNFGAQQIIITNVDGLRDIYFGDLDGDGDMDVVSASAGDNKIAWYENTDSLGSFGAEQIITINANHARAVLAVDIDGDGDLDVLSASQVDSKIAWYENDGQGSFGPQQIITNDPWFGYNVTAGDIDGDGDMDVLAAIAFYDFQKTVWFENTDGLGSFGSEHIITEVGENYLVYPSDLDGDGDLDVICTYRTGNRISDIVWYENIDGLGSFGNYQVIITNISGLTSVYTSDIDGDGDMDVLSASEGDDKIAWYENDGDGIFGAQQIITTNADGASFVFVLDIDGDEYMDVLSASENLAWYENLGPLAVNENTLADFSVFPNPVKDVLNILSQNDNPISSLKVYDILGRLVLEEKDDNINQLDVSNINSGVLFVKINTTEGVSTRKIIKE